MVSDVEIRQQPSVLLQATDLASRLPTKKGEGESDPSDEDIPTLEEQTIDNYDKAQIVLLSQDSTSMPTKAEMVEVQSGAPYRRNVWSLVCTD